MQLSSDEISLFIGVYFVVFSLFEPRACCSACVSVEKFVILPELIYCSFTFV